MSKTVAGLAWPCININTTFVHFHVSSCVSCNLELLQAEVCILVSRDVMTPQESIKNQFKCMVIRKDLKKNKEEMATFWIPKNCDSYPIVS